ncbi:hypothetical protein ACJ41O_012328 [Fusarium nematophilum]
MASLSNLYVTSDHVRRGGWKNWDDGAASGGQITMLKEDAELLGIFIGIFLVFVAAGLWTLIAYLFFQLNRRSRRKRRMRHQDLPQQPPDNFDGMYHQQQTILRNGGSDIAIGLAFLKLWLAWGRHPGALKRTLPVVVLALGSFGFFLVALPFITAQELFDKQGNEVLVQSPNCGFWSPDLQHHPLDASMVWTNKSFEAISYVDSCYESSVESALCDQFLPMRRLPIVKVHGVKCPFDESVCLPRSEGDKHPAFTIKTAELDSHVDFGINAPPKDRIKLRRTTTCSPLNLDKFSKVMDGPLPGEKVTAVYLGPTAGTNFTYTYGVSNYQIVADASYSLQAFYRRIANDATYSSTFAPVPELHRSDADISIAFFKNNMIPVAGIDGPCKDPIFSATRKELAKMRGYWWPDNRLTAIGCVDQYEFGDPVSGGWTKPASYSDATTNTTFIKQLSKRQLAGFTKFIWSLGLAGGIDFVVDILGTEALRAKKYPGLRDKVQNPLPNDQWKREVEYWFMIGLAKVQLDVVNIAMGPADPTFPGIKDETSKVMADRDDILKIICSSQKVHNLEFKNLHRVGFIVLAVAGGLSVVVPSLVLRAIMWRRKRQEDVLMWTSYGQLQLQRMAAEGAVTADRSLVNNAIGDHARINLGDVNHYYGGLAAPAHTIQFSEEADPLPNGLVLSELPSKAECFFGRGAELGRIKEYLQTTGPNQKGVALCGISGSGKTQVALDGQDKWLAALTDSLWLWNLLEYSHRKGSSLSREIPVAFLRNIQLDAYDPVDLCDDWQQLAELFHDQTTLNTAIYGLHRRFLAKRKQGSNREILSISLHQAVCRWRLATIGDDKAVWIMNASSALAKYVRSCCSSEAPGRVSFNMAQQFLSPSHHCLDAIQKHVPQEGLRVSGIYADQYFTVCSSIADIFFATGKYRIARDLFSSALSYLREVEAIEVRPNDQFRLTRGLGISCQQTGDLLTAQKELQAALELADALHGHMSDEVIELNPRLKSVHDRISADLDNRKRVLVAVTDGKRQEGKGDTVSSTSFSPCQSRKLSREEWLRVFEDATQENDEAIVTDVLENGANVNKTSDEENSDTPLTVAVELGTEWIVKLLLEQGADVNINWGEDRGKSLSASLKICHFIWEPMTEILDILVKHGADLGDSPRKMRTGLG